MWNARAPPNAMLWLKILVVAVALKAYGILTEKMLTNGVLIAFGAAVGAMCAVVVLEQRRHTEKRLADICREVLREDVQQLADNRREMLRESKQ